MHNIELRRSKKGLKPLSKAPRLEKNIGLQQSQFKPNDELKTIFLFQSIKNLRTSFKRSFFKIGSKKSQFHKQ